MSSRNTVPYYVVHATACLMIALVAPFIGCGDEKNLPDDIVVSPEGQATDSNEESESASVNDGSAAKFDGVTTCQRDQDCGSLGAWHECLGGHCMVRPESRTILLAGLEINEPQELGASLGGALNELVDLGQLNLLVHLGQSDSWLIQGVTSGSLDGENTYGQSNRFGSYCGQSEIHCSDGTCRTQFQPQSNGERILLYVRDHRIAEDYQVCAYQMLEFVDVTIDVRIDLRAPSGSDTSTPVPTITLSGLLPESIAQDFVMADGDPLADILRRQGMDMNGRTVDGSEDGWRIELVGGGTEVFFDNDPGERFSTVPANPTRGTMSQDPNCF